MLLTEQTKEAFLGEGLKIHVYIHVYMIYYEISEYHTESYKGMTSGDGIGFC